MRVLFLDYTNSIGLGGGQRSLSLLVRHLDRSRFQPVVGCPPGERLREILDPGIPVRDLVLPPEFARISRADANWIRVPAAAGRLWGTVRSLREIVSRDRIDLIHANNLKMAALAALAVPSAPLLWHVRDIFPRTSAVERLVRWTSRAATKVLAVSQAVAHHLPDRSKTEVVYNAVELSREDDCRPAAAPTIGFVGRLDAWKGIEVLVEAFETVRRSRPDAELLVAGDGPQAGRLGRLGIRQVPFQTDLSAIWRQIAVAVTPSIEPDPFPRAVIEAMAHAKPVVASATGGIPEAVDDGVTGFLVRPGRSQELAAALCRLLDAPGMAASMGAAGRRRCEQRFSIEAQQSAVSRIYETVAGVSPSGAAVVGLAS